MLKFQGDYTTLIATFEDFILLVYTMIDDLLKSRINYTYVSRCLAQRVQ